ncbi:hypothetical protein M8C21_031427 [Ambrosia artemisiifolia]|uniref:Homeobox domain-containing protein n=1 Tax=Ambrosia artemisiifolia TaxID=4212 RepID=A0AAD5CUR1_AMBAR|nr:hypothetical protein M8C21_031427 [Ambrosia artemisiifolia]
MRGRKHYPDHGAKENLAKELNLTISQVSKWFENVRWRFNHPEGRSRSVKSPSESAEKLVTKQENEGSYPQENVLEDVHPYYGSEYVIEYVYQTMSGAARLFDSFLMTGKYEGLAVSKCSTKKYTYATLIEEGIKIPAWFSFKFHSCCKTVNVVTDISLIKCAKIADSRQKIVAVGINYTQPRFISCLNSSFHKGVPDEAFVSYLNKWCQIGALFAAGGCRTTPNTMKDICRAPPHRSSYFTLDN